MFYEWQTVITGLLFQRLKCYGAGFFNQIVHSIVLRTANIHFFTNFVFNITHEE